MIKSTSFVKLRCWKKVCIFFFEKVPQQVHFNCSANKRRWKIIQRKGHVDALLQKLLACWTLRMMNLLNFAEKNIRVIPETSRSLLRVPTDNFLIKFCQIPIASKNLLLGNDVRTLSEQLHLSFLHEQLTRQYKRDSAWTDNEIHFDSPNCFPFAGYLISGEGKNERSESTENQETKDLCLRLSNIIISIMKRDGIWW